MSDNKCTGKKTVDGKSAEKKPEEGKLTDKKSADKKSVGKKPAKEKMTDKKHEGDTNIYDCLKLENQLCFPLYAVSKEIVRRYKPFLDEIDLTYTQYICMMLMWEKEELTVKELGGFLYLDSGTLTPVLKTLEKKGFVLRTRDSKDERNLIVKITDEGMKLREEAVKIPAKMGACVNLSAKDAKELYRILHTMLAGMER